mgnify:CR=1 FL=1
MEYIPKYTARFESKAYFCKKDFAKSNFVSKASLGLDNLASLLPDSKEIVDNPDLLYTCFNAAVVNLVNLNGDAISTEGAKTLVASCKNKPTNIEHERSSVIGVVTNYGFSSFGENKILTLDELTDDPFNISLAAIVWKICNRSFAEFIEDSQDEDGYCYKAVSTSWEVGFDSYKLALGSKDLRRARIVEDEAEVEDFSQYLMCMGGTGFTPAGEEVYRVIGGECIFLGCAFTSNPAAAVQGVMSVDYKSVIDDQEEDDTEEEMDASIKEIDTGESKTIDPQLEAEASIEKNFQENSLEISQQAKKRVFNRMKYNTLDELVDNLQEAHASDVRDFVVSQVQKANDAFVALQSEKEAKEKALEDAIASTEEIKAAADALKAEVAQLRASIKAQEDDAKFAARMESLKEQYEVDDAASKSIAKRIDGLSDEAFAEWLEDMKPLLKVKSQDKVDDVSLQSVASVNAPIPNSQSEKEDKAAEWSQVLKSVKIKL